MAAERDWIDPGAAAIGVAAVVVALGARGRDRGAARRLEAEIQRHAHERDVMFAEVFRLEVMLARYGPRVGKRSKEAKRESVRRQARRDKNATAGDPSPCGSCCSK